MQYDEFIDQVQARIGAGDRDEAVETIKAVLATLGERIYRTERADLAAQLPGELKAYLSERQEPEASRRQTDRFLKEEFYNRISARTETSYADAASRTRAVMAVLRDAVSPGTLDRALAELPEDMLEDFGVKPG